MKKHRPILLLTLALVLTLPSIVRAEVEWQTDFKKAQEEAKSNHKFLLVEFTGSDWCPPCMRLRKDVFSTREFQDYANKNFVLLELDFPRRKSLSKELTMQNQELASRFGIEVFPSIIILNSEGKKVGELLGYDPTVTVQNYISELEKARKS
ncbi:MAG: thioredoxin family protein [Spartobacteria bacterium]